MSEDPSMWEGMDSNLYRYVGNCATNCVDPSGLKQANPMFLDWLTWRPVSAEEQAAAQQRHDEWATLARDAAAQDERCRVEKGFYYIPDLPKEPSPATYNFFITTGDYLTNGRLSEWRETIHGPGANDYAYDKDAAWCGHTLGRFIDELTPLGDFIDLWDFATRREDQRPPNPYDDGTHDLAARGRPRFRRSGRSRKSYDKKAPGQHYEELLQAQRKKPGSIDSTQGSKQCDKQELKELADEALKGLREKR